MTREDDDPGDAPDDDAATRSMRSVWLTMREEDPPSSGLAELMAAARSKAAEMTPREPWWQRLFATLRRPPVLALATVMLLVGGAVIIGKRRTELKIEQMAPVSPSAEPAVEAPPPDLDTMSPSPPATAPPATADPAAASPGLAKDRQTKPRPRRPSQDQKYKPDHPVIAPLDLGSTTLEQKPVHEGEAARGSRGGQLDPPPTEHAGEDSVTTRGPRPVTVAQLVEQTAAAAARGDCATVKSTSERIRKLNPAVYTEQVAKNQAIANCLR